MLASLSAQAQMMRVRGTISSLDGDVLSVKTREGKDIKIQLAPDAAVAVTKKVKASEFKAGSYVGVTSVKDKSGHLVAKRVHALGPQVPQMHGAWDSIPNSMMTNSNITGITKVKGGSELTLQNKEGEQKIMVDKHTEYFNFEPGTRADLKKGETIFTGARVDGDKLLAQRVAVSKNGVKPPQ
jgi:RNase P/RNase MRP subunit p29